MIQNSTEPVYFLLVDDLNENLIALEGLLRREGLVLLKARSGVEALEHLLKHDIALAFLDVQMPEMDGFELAEMMRGSERTRRVPIIFLTAGHTDWSRRFRGYEAGAVDFIQKPIEPHILKSKAEVFFQLYQQRQEVAQQRDCLKAATEENVRLLNESRQYSQALREADQRKDDFLAMLAHELRNPLAPVRSAVEILKLCETTDAMVAQVREIISRQVSHMVRLVDDLLDVARIARGKVQLRMEQCDLASIVRQTAEDYRQTLADSGITMKLDISDSPLILSGDPTRLAQVVGNLLHNSAKFTPRGGVVEICCIPDSLHRDAIVSVTDTGAGLEASVLSRLFEPFSQANQRIDRDKGGLGLGLALVKGLVNLHGGVVEASSPGLSQGSTFTLKLPLSDKGNISRNIRQIAGDARFANKGLRILIVEDNRDAAVTMKSLLTLMGHEVAVAYDGHQGLSTARVFQPMVVISDLGLPGSMNGYTLARELRADPLLSSVYLIALSGYGQDDDRKKTEEAGFDRHLVKPVELESLYTALDHIGAGVTTAFAQT